MDIQEFSLHTMTETDVPAVLELSDRCVGKGLYSEGQIRELLERPTADCRVLRAPTGALAGYCLTYLADAREAADTTKLSMETLRSLTPGRMPRVGICKSLGTEATYRGLGLGCQLQEACVDGLFQKGADFLLGVAWRKGYHVPVRGILERLGFSFLQDTQRVWYDEEGLSCPYCGEERCICPAAIFIRERGTRCD
ncbi:MAG: hypothetical protein RR295_03120 [Oscillospiraceae bacterium]